MHPDHCVQRNRRTIHSRTDNPLLDVGKRRHLPNGVIASQRTVDTSVNKRLGYGEELPRRRVRQRETWECHLAIDAHPQRHEPITERSQGVPHVTYRVPGIPLAVLIGRILDGVEYRGATDFARLYQVEVASKALFV